MNIALAALPLSLTNAQENLSAMRGALHRLKGQNVDLLLFGEASLSGFEALRFDPLIDKDRAMTRGDHRIAALRSAVVDAGIALGFGFYYKEGPLFYSAYLILEKTGEEKIFYLRRSPGWKIPQAPDVYQEGQQTSVFELNGRRFALMICGDFWQESLLDTYLQLDATVDAFLWPVHCDYSPQEWRQEAKADYQARTGLLKNSVLFVNSYIEEPGRAKGGAYHWQNGKTRCALAPGSPGLLLVHLP